MTAPGQGEPPAPAPQAATHEFPLIAWARAIAFGIGDTARDMLDEGRRGAREAYDDGWRRFDAKTRFRRRKRDR